MGAGASKQAGKAAAAAGRRQYPSSSSILNNATSTSNAPSQSARPFAPSQVHPNPQEAPPSEDSKSQIVELDGRDPQFGARLGQLGPAISVEKAVPNAAAFPTSSQPPLGQQGQNIFPTRAPGQNAGLSVVQARDRIAQKFDQEMEGLGRASFTGRTLVSAKDIKEILRMREQGGQSSSAIEKQMRLQSGILDQLVKPGLFGNVRTG